MRIKRKIYTTNTSYIIHFNPKQSRELELNKEKIVQVKINGITFIVKPHLANWTQRVNGNTSYEYRITIPKVISEKLKLKRGQLVDVEIKNEQD
jgi:antitoxin component of MazEF toxin-antitoxin module